jgi:hypothetical protein
MHRVGVMSINAFRLFCLDDRLLLRQKSRHITYLQVMVIVCLTMCFVIFIPEEITTKVPN